MALHGAPVTISQPCSFQVYISSIGSIGTEDEEAQRLATLHAFSILDTPAAPEFDRLTRLAARLLQAPISQISLIDAQRQWVKSCAGAPRGETPRHLAFCSVTIGADEPLVVTDATLDPRFADNPFVTGEPHVRFYAGVPLILDGARIGSLCVIDSKARTLSSSDLEVLQSLAELVCDQLWLHRKSMELELSESRFRLAALAASDALYEWDLKSDELTWGRGLDHQFPEKPLDHGTTGSEWAAQIHPDDRAEVLDGVYQNIENGGQSWSGEYRIKRVDGSYASVIDRCFILRDPAGSPIRVIGAMHDISTRKRAEEQLNHTAYHDSLTGLPNRALFLKHMEEALKNAERMDGSVGLIYLDLDDFKEVNDTLGHHAGDAVLIEASHRLKQSVPDEAMVARLGGDEFAILLSTAAASKQAEKIALDIQAALSIPMMYEGDELSCKASLGIALYPESDARASELMKNADLALYAAKRLGGNQHAFFTPEVRKAVQQKVSALACARDALLRDAIVPFYQPKVSLETGKLHGFEALLRWMHPRNGIQPPGLIREAFEDPVLSVEIGRRMLQRVIQDMKAWQKERLKFGSIGINVSGQQFSRTDIAGDILASFEEAELSPALLEVEITETVFLGDGSNTVGHALHRLHDQGVSIALDDFGTGYASLTHLTKFPVSWLKIDQSFVRNMGQSPDDVAIIKAVIALAHSVGIQVVAEGVETQQQWDRLRDKGCDLAQGYLVAKPMSSAHVPFFIRNWAGTNKASPDRSLTV